MESANSSMMTIPMSPRSAAKYEEDWERITAELGPPLHGWDEEPDILTWPKEDVQECLKQATDSWAEPNNVVIIDAWFCLLGGFYPGALRKRTVRWHTVYEWVDKVTCQPYVEPYSICRLKKDGIIGEPMNPNHLACPGVYILLSKDGTALRVARASFHPIDFRGVKPDAECEEICKGTAAKCFLSGRKAGPLTTTFVLPPSAPCFNDNKEQYKNSNHSPANLFLIRDNLLHAWHNFYIMVDSQTGQVIPLVKGYDNLSNKQVDFSGLSPEHANQMKTFLQQHADQALHRVFACGGVVTQD